MASSMRENEDSAEEDDVHVHRAQTVDAFGAAVVVDGAFKALNSRHGYEEITDHDHHQVAAIARRFAASIKHDMKSIFVATAANAHSLHGRRGSKQIGIATVVPPGTPISAARGSGIFVQPKPKVLGASPLAAPVILSAAPGLGGAGGAGTGAGSGAGAGGANAAAALPAGAAAGTALGGATGGESPGSSRRGSLTRASSGLSQSPSLSPMPHTNARRPSFTSVKINIEREQRDRDKVVGMVGVDKRDAVFGIGPIAVAPERWNQGTGRKLIQTVLQDWTDCRTTTYGISLRLTQESYNTSSLALFIKCGFQVREPLVFLRGNPSTKQLPPGYSVRAMTRADLPACEHLMDQVFGYRRSGELKDAIEDPERHPFVAEKDNVILAYTSTLGVDGHGCAVELEDMKALIIGVAVQYEAHQNDSQHDKKEGAKRDQSQERKESRAGEHSLPAQVSLLVPSRQEPQLLEWCLTQRMGLVKQLSLLTLGEYHAPKANHIYFPSLLY